MLVGLDTGGAAGVSTADPSGLAERADAAARSGLIGSVLAHAVASVEPTITTGTADPAPPA